MVDRQEWTDWKGRVGNVASYGEEESVRLFELAKEQTQPWIIEIGAWEGYSAMLMAAGSLHLPETRVLTVDLWLEENGQKGAVFDEQEAAKPIAEQTHPFRDWLGSTDRLRCLLHIADDVGLLPRLLPLRMDSLAAAQVWSTISASAGLIHFDAEHTYDATIDNADAWLPCLAPGGVAAFHDYCESYAGVIEACDEIAQETHWSEQRLDGCLFNMRYTPDAS